jgi:DivIVA domain-containing protein
MAMELTPELLLEAKFAPARRGYDMAEVDDFLERCAEGLDVLLARLRAEFDRAEQAEAEVRSLRERTGAPIADAAVAEPEAEAEASSEPAPETAAPAPQEPAPIEVAEAERIRVEAESVASTQHSEAETLLARAKAEAEAEARAAGEEAKRAIQTEVVTLRRDRDALSDDVRALRRWLDEQRARMRTAARDMQRLAEDPSALRDVAAPELSVNGATGPRVDDAVDNGAAAGDDEVITLGDDVGNGASSAAVPAAHGEVAGDDAGDGEPTQAVPAFGLFRPFDDDRVDDEITADSVR